MGKTKSKASSKDSPGELWWARVQVDWLPDEESDQVIVLPEAQAGRILQWLATVPCTSLTQAIAAAPDLEDELIELAEEMEWEDDEFSFSAIPGVADGDLPPPPWQLMEDSLPRELVERYGTSTPTAINGDFAYLRGEEVDGILGWLTDHGYTPVEHPELQRTVDDISA
jgi:hypothetical protein